LTLDNIIDVRITERDTSNESSGAASPKEQTMNFPTIYVNAGLISWQPFIRQNNKGLEALVEIFFLSPTALPGTLPPTDKVPSSCLGHSLFEAIFLAKPFWVDVHPTYIGFIERGLSEASGCSLNNQQVNCLLECPHPLDCYMIIIAGVTHSGIQFFTWTQRFIQRLALEGYEDGWAFRKMDGTRAKASDYQDNIFQKLEIVQATTTLIDPGCSVWDEYGIQRSGWRFFTTRCTNMKVDKHDIATMSLFYR
jgi:hypothetical protein